MSVEKSINIYNRWQTIFLMLFEYAIKENLRTIVINLLPLMHIVNWVRKSFLELFDLLLYVTFSSYIGARAVAE